MIKGVLYDARKEKVEFDKKIAKFEIKLTKAKQKGRKKKLELLETDARQLIRDRFHKLSQYEFDGFGVCESSIKYDENGEAKIFVTFKKSEMECVTGEEFARLLNEVSSNNVEKYEISEKAGNNKGKEKMQNHTQSKEASLSKL